MISEYGFSEYDANTALAELDKALRSNNVGEKAEIIVKVPTYFEKYPLPVFVNSVFLKLTELFRSSTTNFLRKCVLQVAERSESHVDKIISCDEIAKRILTVSYSNDPIARSQTLRLIGCLSHVLSDRQQIHHLIRTSLDSRDDEELSAAIFAAERFAQHSDEFSKAIYEKVAEMLLNNDVSLETKIAVVPVFQHMHTDPLTTEKVFSLCKTKLLPCYHDPVLICSILSTLTGLALSSLTIFSSQIELLLDALNNSKSFKVKRTALMCLKRITKTAPHFWTKEMFQVLCDYMINFDHSEKSHILRLDVLKVLSSLTKNKIIVSWGDMNALGYHILATTSSWISLKCDNVLAALFEVLANVIQNGEKTESMEHLAERFFTVVSEVIPIWDWKSQDDHANLYAKKLLRSLVVFCKSYKKFAAPISRMICCLLPLFSGDKESIVYETLFSLYDCEPNVMNVIQSSIPTTFDNFRRHFELMSSSVEFVDYVSETIDERCNGWSLYKFGRFATKYGKFDVAARIFEHLENIVVTDTFYHWIKFLNAVTSAEYRLTSKEKLSESISLYIKALFYLKAAATNTISLWFANEFVTLRIEFLKLLDDIRTMWNICRVTPPPTAILISNDPLEKASQLITQFNSCVKSMTLLSDKYEKLISNCFDADTNSLYALRLEQLKCYLVQQSLLVILNGEYQKICVPNKENLNACCKLVAENLDVAESQLITIVRNEPDKLSGEVIERVLNVVEELTRKSTFFPRYFFQALQTTSIKLVISPQPQSSETTLVLPTDQRLALKVEGVIAYTGSKKIRRVSEVTLYLTTDFGEVAAERKGAIPMDQRLEKSVKPHNNYFSVEFVVQCPQSGVIIIRADVTDDVEGRVWDIGVEEQLKVKIVGHGKSSTTTTPSSSLLAALPFSTSSPMNRT